jgi:hypothetical protein
MDTVGKVGKTVKCSRILFVIEKETVKELPQGSVSLDFILVLILALLKPKCIVEIQGLTIC